MATEVAITSRTPLDVASLTAAGAATAPECALLELRDGEVWVVVDPEGERVVTVHASTPIEVRSDVVALVGPARAESAWWTMATVPHGGPAVGMELIRALAGELDGVATVLT